MSVPCHFLPSFCPSAPVSRMLHLGRHLLMLCLEAFFGFVFGKLTFSAGGDIYSFYLHEVVF